MPDYSELARQLAPALAAWFPLNTADQSGTFTPTYYGATSAGTTTYTTQSGAYRRLGPLVFVSYYVVWTAATGTGNVRLSLPYAAASGTQATFRPYTSAVTYSGGPPVGLIQGGNSYAQLLTTTSNVGSSELTIEAAGEIRFSVVYATG